MGISNNVMINKVESLEAVMKERDGLRAQLEDLAQKQHENVSSRKLEGSTCQTHSFKYSAWDAVLDVLLVSVLALSITVTVTT